MKKGKGNRTAHDTGTGRNDRGTHVGMPLFAKGGRRHQSSGTDEIAQVSVPQQGQFGLDLVGGRLMKFVGRGDETIEKSDRHERRQSTTYLACTQYVNEVLEWIGLDMVSIIEQYQNTKTKKATCQHLEQSLLWVTIDKHSDIHASRPSINVRHQPQVQSTTKYYCTYATGR